MVDPSKQETHAPWVFCIVYISLFILSIGITMCHIMYFPCEDFHLHIMKSRTYFLQTYTENTSNIFLRNAGLPDQSLYIVAVSQ